MARRARYRSVCRDTIGHHLAWLSGDRPAWGCHVLDKEPPVSVDVSTDPADLEQGRWPYSGRLFTGVVVTNYLHRPLLPLLLTSIADDGVLIYETFARGNERYGRPSNPQFLLEPGELLRAVAGRMRVLAFEDLYVDEPKPAMVQRICAVRPD